jgi:formate dehydrogenase major subunit
MLFSEIELSGNEVLELNNLVYITGKSGKTASGLICLKEKNNSQGIWDMGLHPSVSVGSRLNSQPDVVLDRLREGTLRNLFIFGEDPIGCASDPEYIREWMGRSEFIVVQDYFMTETAGLADLVLPSSLPYELEGTFTNTQRVIQEFQPFMTGKQGNNSIGQLVGMLGEFGLNGLKDSADARNEALKTLATGPLYEKIFNFTTDNNYSPLFNHGCDWVVKIFDEEFHDAFSPHLTEID